MPSKRVAVLGGGLQGACIALELARRGVTVDLYERNLSCSRRPKLLATDVICGAVLGQGNHDAKDNLRDSDALLLVVIPTSERQQNWSVEAPAMVCLRSQFSEN